MSLNYETLDYLSDLSKSDRSDATLLTFEPAEDSDYDNSAFVYDSGDYAILRDDFKFFGSKNAVYSIVSESFFDPFLLRLYDKDGNVVAVDTYDSLGVGDYGYDYIINFTAPYSGIYYISASWNQGDYYTDCSLFVFETLDNVTPTTSTGNDSLTAANTTQTFDGLAGIDTLSYTNATKSVTVSLASSKAQNTGFGTHTIKNIENIIGSKYNDKLTGSSVNNEFVGSSGSDKLTGGAGSDTFTYKALTDSQVTASKRDTITDFKSGADKIDLSALDANTVTTTNDKFTTLISSTANFSTAGQLQLKNGVLYGNTDTDATAEFAIALTGVKSLTMTDFIA